MGQTTLVIATLCYLVTAYDLAFKQANPVMGGTFLFYAAANCCLLLAAYHPAVLSQIK